MIEQLRELHSLQRDPNALIKVKTLKRIPNISYTPILARPNMIKSPDDNELVHYQYNYATKKITPNFSEDTFSHFIQATKTNGSQGGKGGTLQGGKVGTYPRRKKDTTSQGFHMNYNWIRTETKTILDTSTACPYIVFGVMKHHRNKSSPDEGGGRLPSLRLTSLGASQTAQPVTLISVTLNKTFASS